MSGTFMVGFEGQRRVYRLIHPVGWRTVSWALASLNRTLNARSRNEETMINQIMLRCSTGVANVEPKTRPVLVNVDVVERDGPIPM